MIELGFTLRLNSKARTPSYCVYKPTLKFISLWYSSCVDTSTLNTLMEETTICPTLYACHSSQVLMHSGPATCGLCNIGKDNLLHSASGISSVK